MRAAVVDRFGGPEVLTQRVVPVPGLAASEVLIAVDTAGVGSWDADMREGWWPDSKRPQFPLVMGTDGSGTIAAVGARVRRFTLGERVYAAGGVPRLARAKEAHARLARGHVLGKIVLRGRGR